MCCSLQLLLLRREIAAAFLINHAADDVSFRYLPGGNDVMVRRDVIPVTSSREGVAAAALRALGDVWIGFGVSLSSNQGFRFVIINRQHTLNRCPTLELR